MSGQFALYNTMSGSVEPFLPIAPPEVLMYTCGPTVYNALTLGNWRTYIFEDVLERALKRNGFEVKRVMNITDVGHLTSDADEGEDKLEIGAKREGKTAWEIAQHYEGLFFDQMKAFNLKIPEIIVRATDTIPAQIDFVQHLELQGLTYALQDGIYFDSSKVDHYGKLAKLDIPGLQAGKRVDMQVGKRLPTDFAVWKFSPHDQKRDMEWESPWGKGFPGWHIECSAIIRETLGDSIDIHCGGIDHISVHHTNEIAQSESLTGKPLSGWWCHAEFLLIDGGRMGKSLGNAYTLEDLEKRGFSALDFRYFTYSAHYRAKLNFTWEALTASQVSLHRLRHHFNSEIAGIPDEGEGREVMQEIDQALADDLNVPQVVAHLWQLARSNVALEVKRSIASQVDSFLCLDLLKLEVPLRVPKAVQEIVQAREMVRANKDWTRSDQLREQIAQAGFRVEDKEDGPILIPRVFQSTNAHEPGRNP